MLVASLLLLLAATASSGPISNINQPFQFANTLFTGFDKDQKHPPRNCFNINVPGATVPFARCSNVHDTNYVVSLEQMKQIWATFQPWKGKDTTINSRKADFSVTLFDTIDENVPQWTIEHGRACQKKGAQGEQCLLIQFIRHDDYGQYTQVGQACGMPGTKPCTPNAECLGTVSNLQFKTCQEKFAQYHEKCGGGGGFDLACAPGLRCQFEGPFRGARGRCARMDEPLYGPTFNTEGGKCDMPFEACQSGLTCFMNTCRALAGARAFCRGGNNHKECVPGYKCKFGENDDKEVAMDQQGTCFPVKGNLNELCEVRTGCADGLECKEQAPYRLCLPRSQ